MSQSSLPVKPTKRVVLVGGESTGKSTLAAALSKHFDCPLATEFARDYLTEHGAEYGLETSLVLACGQRDREEEAMTRAIAENKPLVLSDTDPLTTMLWAEYYFKKTHPDVEAMLPTLKHDLHLLCTPGDLPWDDDGLRRSPNSRAWFTKRLKEELTRRNMPYLILDQPLTDRLDAAIDKIQSLL